MRRLVPAGVVAIAALATTATAQAAQPADGPLNSFYAAPSGLAKAPAGKLLRKRALTSAQLLPGAARGYKVLYASRGHLGQKIVVSGLVYLPTGKAPAGGWPTISYAHGTVGVVNRCAPSNRLDLPPFLGEYLKAGFAFVATDYQGLGPAGPHPYLNGTMEAYNQIDMVRAARQADPGLSRKWMAVGQSQGGQATLFTAARATKTAPELDYRGGISTAPPSMWDIQVVETTETGRVLTPVVIEALSFFNGSIDPPALLTDDGRTLLDAFYTGCLADTVLGVFPSIMGKKLTIGDPASLYPPFKKEFDELEPPIVKLDRPIYIAEGGADEFVVPRATRLLAQGLRARGSDVTYREFPGVMHRPTAQYALALGLPFARKLFGLSPYKRLRINFTASKTASRTGFSFLSELPPPPAGFGSPTLRSNEFRYPAGTRLDPGAVPACDATDATLTARGTSACAASTRIGTGSADVRLGSGTTLPLKVTAFNAGARRLTIVLTGTDGGVLRILHPAVAGNTVRTTLPKVSLGGGEEASLTRFALNLTGGTDARPLIRTPATCPANGRWTITYVSRYDAPLGTERFERPTRCNPTAGKGADDGAPLEPYLP